METKKRFNVIDGIILFIVAVILVGGAFAIKQFVSDTNEETKTIVVEVTEQKKALCDIIKKGDVAYDGVENVILGTIANYEVRPAQIDSVSTLDGAIRRVNIPDRYDILLTIEVPLSVEVQVGKQLWIDTSIFKCNGYVLSVDDGGKAALKK